MPANSLGSQCARRFRQRRGRSAVLRAAGVVLLATTGARAADEEAVITLRVQLPQDGGALGHIWTVITPEEGPQANLSLAYGLYPKETSLFNRNPTPTGARGAVNSDAATNWNYSISYPVDATQLSLAQHYIELQRSLQQSGTLGFDLLSANSADFARGLATATNLTLPRITNGFGINDPATFGDALRQLGAGGSFSGGTVSVNSASFLAPATTPLDFSHAALLQRALATPSTLATQVGVPLMQYSPASASASGTFSLAVSGITLNESMLAVDWGDGSDIGVQTLSLQHLYTANGTYNGRLIVLENGAVHSVNFTANISTGAGSATVPITINNQTDLHLTNGGTSSTPFLAVPAHWKQNGTGSWLTATNWTSDLPNGVGAWTVFDPSYGVTSPTTVVVNSPVSVGTLDFVGQQNFTIGGSSTLTVATSTGSAGFIVESGSHTITAPVVLNSDALINLQGAGTLQILGSFSAAGRTITKDGNGRLVMPTVRAGTLNILQDEVFVTFKGTPNSTSGTSIVNVLSVASGAVMDLTNNSLVIDYSGSVGTLVTTVRRYIKNGQLTGVDNGTFGVGYGDNVVLNYATFSGAAVDATSILVKPTYDGDANLDGKVDIRDLLRLALGWHAAGPWTSGDFNYDGTVNETDLGILAKSWQAGVGAPLGEDSLTAMLGDLGLPDVSIPEPVSGVAMITMGWVGAARRRRRATGNSK